MSKKDESELCLLMYHNGSISLDQDPTIMGVYMKKNLAMIVKDFLEDESETESGAEDLNFSYVPLNKFIPISYSYETKVKVHDT